MILIANPAAGGGKVRKQWTQILATLRPIFPDLKTVQTSRVGEGKDLAVQAIADGHRGLISLGGDGTHSEVASGIHASGLGTEVSLGPLHGGTGGDFCRMLGKGSLAERALRLRELPSSTIDLGCVTWTEHGTEKSRVFLNECSIGMGATVCAKVNNSKKRFGGTVTFFTQTIRTLATYKAQPVNVLVDGREIRPGNVQTIQVCNGRWAGGGMKFAPSALLDDGELDLTIIGETGPLDSARFVPKLYNGRVLQASHVHGDRGTQIRIQSLGVPLLIEADGEVLGTTEAVFTVIPGALKLMGAPDQAMSRR